MSVGLILFVHGLGGNANSTWGKFGNLIQQDTELSKYDIAFFDYPTSLFRLPFSKKYPRIQTLANALRTQINTKFYNHTNIILVCHSLGGLIAKRYLIDEVKHHEDLRIQSLLLFSVPNNGAGLASAANMISWRHNQLRQLCKDSDLLTDINEDWVSLNINKLIQVKYVVADQDSVVSKESAQAYYGNREIAVVLNRGHIDVVKPMNSEDMPFLILRKFVLSSATSPEEPKPGVQNSAYGFKINKIIWKHYYFSNSNFKAEIEYYLQNNSEFPLVDLPPHEAGWFGWDIKYTFKTDVYGEYKNFYSIDDKYFSDNKIIRNDLNGRDSRITMLNWQFKVSPPIAPKKLIHYGIIIETENTEKEAFTGGGSLAGMSSPYPVDKIISEIFAPDGYFFVNNGFIVRDRTGISIEGNINPPDFSDDDKKINWVVEKPSPTLQYLVRIVLVKRD